MYSTKTQFVPLETKVHLSPAMAFKMAVPAEPPAIGTTLEDAETTV